MGGRQGLDSLPIDILSMIMDMIGDTRRNAAITIQRLLRGTHLHYKLTGTNMTIGYSLQELRRMYALKTSNFSTDLGLHPPNLPGARDSTNFCSDDTQISLAWER